MNEGIIKTLFLKIGALFVSILTVLGIIPTPQEPPPEPPIVFEQNTIETPNSPSEKGSKDLSEEPPDEKKAIEEPIKISSATESSPQITEGITSTNDLNTQVRKSIVNVFCVSKQSGINSISGSGVVIDPRGVVLTNAHIGEYFLLNDLVQCTLRTGSPAENEYKADLLYISPSWIEDNYTKITEENPKGTGENDFALLKITDRTNPNAILPNSFLFVPIDISPEQPKEDDSVLIVGYPAGFLGGTIIQSGLSLVSTIGNVSNIYTFDTNTVDLFSVFGSILAQRGASGGAVIDNDGKLIGIIVTATQEETTGMRELRAITLSHINRSLEIDSGIGLSNFLTGDLEGKALQFQSLIAPGLKKLLLEAIF